MATKLKDKVCIPIDKRYALSADKHGWSISERKQRMNKETGKMEPYWEEIRWFINLGSAVQGLIHLKVQTSGAETACQLKESLASALSEVVAVLRPLKLVKVVKSYDSTDCPPIKKETK